MNLSQIIKIFQVIFPLFDLVSFFHILRGNNQEADKLETLACRLNAERSIVNEIDKDYKFPKHGKGFQTLDWGRHSWLDQEVRK